MGQLKHTQDVPHHYAQRVRTCYGPHATYVSITLRRRTASLRVTDEAGEPIEPRDDASFEDLLGLLDDALAWGGPGHFTLVGRPTPAPLSPSPPEGSHLLLPW